MLESNDLEFLMPMEQVSQTEY